MLKVFFGASEKKLEVSKEGISQKLQAIQNSLNYPTKCPYHIGEYLNKIVLAPEYAICCPTCIKEKHKNAEVQSMNKEQFLIDQISKLRRLLSYNDGLKRNLLSLEAFERDLAKVIRQSLEKPITLIKAKIQIHAKIMDHVLNSNFFTLEFIRSHQLERNISQVKNIESQLAKNYEQFSQLIMNFLVQNLKVGARKESSFHKAEISSSQMFSTPNKEESKLLTTDKTPKTEKHLEPIIGLNGQLSNISIAENINIDSPIYEQKSFFLIDYEESKQSLLAAQVVRLEGENRSLAEDYRKTLKQLQEHKKTGVSSTSLTNSYSYSQDSRYYKQAIELKKANEKCTIQKKEIEDRLIEESQKCGVLSTQNRSLKQIAKKLNQESANFRKQVEELKTKLKNAQAIAQSQRLAKQRQIEASHFKNARQKEQSSLAAKVNQLAIENQNLRKQMQKMQNSFANDLNEKQTKMRLLGQSLEAARATSSQYLAQKAVCQKQLTQVKGKVVEIQAKLAEQQKIAVNCDQKLRRSLQQKQQLSSYCQILSQNLSELRTRCTQFQAEVANARRNPVITFNSNILSPENQTWLVQAFSSHTQLQIRRIRNLFIFGPHSLKPNQEFFRGIPNILMIACIAQGDNKFIFGAYCAPEYGTSAPDPSLKTFIFSINHNKIFRILKGEEPVANCCNNRWFNMNAGFSLTQKSLASLLTLNTSNYENSDRLTRAQLFGSPGLPPVAFEVYQLQF